jgi:hypothetical protein
MTGQLAVDCGCILPAVAGQAFPARSMHPYPKSSTAACRRLILSTSHLTFLILDPTGCPAHSSRKKVEFMMISNHSKKAYWLIGLGFLGLLSLLCVFLPFQTIWDDGTKEMDFHFLVLDTKTKKPLQNVEIGLYDEITKEWQQIKTDANGEANIDLSCMITCKIRSGIFLSNSRRSIYYPHRMLLLSKNGYKEKGPLNLTDLVGWGHAGDYSPPPQMQLELEQE